MPRPPCRVRGQVVLQHEDYQSVHGDGPLLMHVRWVLLPSGAGHFMLHQSWILPDPDDCVLPHAPVHKEVAVPAREGVDDVLGGLAEGGAALVSAAKALHKADADRGIVSDVQARREAVQEAGRAEGFVFPRNVESLIVAASCVYDKRLSDIGVWEHVLLLWIVDGDCNLRSHNGTVYQYGQGA